MLPALISFKQRGQPCQYFPISAEHCLLYLPSCSPLGIAFHSHLKMAPDPLSHWPYVITLHGIKHILHFIGENCGKVCVQRRKRRRKRSTSDQINILSVYRETAQIMATMKADLSSQPGQSSSLMYSKCCSHIILSIQWHTVFVLFGFVSIFVAKC